MLNLQRGERRKLTEMAPSLSLSITVEFDMDGLDVSVFGLDDEQQLRREAYFVFYNQPRSPEGEIVLALHPRQATFDVDLARLPADVTRLVFVATHDERPLAQATRLTWQVDRAASFDVLGHLGDERALMLAEVYRRGGEWRVAAVAQGFSGGLGKLLAHFGGEVAEDVPHAPPPGTGGPSPSAPEQAWHLLESGGVAPASDRTCTRCGTSGSLLNRVGRSGRCGRCEQAYQKALARFRAVFQQACADGILTLDEWTGLQALVKQERLNAEDALTFVRGDALSFLERTVAIASADGELSTGDEEAIERLRRLFKLPHGMTAHIDDRLTALKRAAQIRAGHLPTVQTPVLLEAGELCHFYGRATYRRVRAKSYALIPGVLTVTNRQILFTSAEGGHAVKYKNLLRVEELSEGVQLDLSVKSGSGLYLVDDPLTTAAVIDAVVRLHKRLLTTPQTERASRHIPQHVKIEVWNRYGGRCAQCENSEYLEYDHIIPHSRGGATTVGNLQLLCRRCNLAKGDRL